MISATLTPSSDSRTAAGIIMLTVGAVDYGGTFLLRVRGREPKIEFQNSFARVGHARGRVGGPHRRGPDPGRRREHERRSPAALARNGISTATLMPAGRRRMSAGTMAVAPLGEREYVDRATTCR